jgi:hypothetical protein
MIPMQRFLNPVAWGGNTWPQLSVRVGANVRLFTLAATDGAPRVKLEWSCQQDFLQVNRLASARMRRRGGDWRMRFRLTAGRWGNADLVEFVRAILDDPDEVIIRPHPGQLCWSVADDTDYWSVVPEGHFDPAYFYDRWAGHQVVLPLIGVDPMSNPPKSTIQVVGDDAYVLGDEVVNGYTYWNERPFENEGVGVEAADERNIAYWEV